MTAKMRLSAAWNTATYGVPSMTVTDSAGVHAPISLAAGYYDHDLCRTAGVVSPSMSSFGGALQTLLNAMGPRVYTLTYVNGRYTISVNSGTFSVAFSDYLMPQLLGVGSALVGAGSIPATTSFTSTYYPWFVIVPAKPGPTNYAPFAKMAGATKEARADAGKPYRNRSTANPRVATWEHQYEPKYMVDADAFVATGESITHLYTWEWLWRDYGFAQLPIGGYIERTDGNSETFAFSLQNGDYDSSVYSRIGRYDDKFKIAMKAELWPGATTDSWCRGFNL